VVNERTSVTPAETIRSRVSAAPDLLALAIRLATTPCSPLYSKHVSLDRELAALLLRSVPPPAK